jgi:hypothetical protein
MNRQALINAIAELKETAIKAGFDFPSQAPAEATTAELKEFLEELQLYLSDQK